MATKTAPRTHVARPAGRWALANLARDLWRRFRDSAHAMGMGAWVAWARALAVGLILTCLVALGLTLWARSADPRGLADWDRATLEAIIEREPISFSRAIVFESPGNQVGTTLIIWATAALAIYLGRPLVAASMPVGYMLGVAAFWVGWGLWDRARPDLVLGGVASPGLHSFPSGHMVHVTLLYGYLTYLWCRSSRSLLERALAVALCACWVALVGLARLILGAHWPSDILAGALLGLLLVATLAVAQRAAERRAVLSS